MGLTVADVLPDYQASLNDAASVFLGAAGNDTTDLKRHLQRAAIAMATDKRPRSVTAILTVSAGKASYDDVPSDLLYPQGTDWGLRSNLPVWELPSSRLPSLRLTETGTGRALMLVPAPTWQQIQVFGASLEYRYAGAHALTADAATSTLDEADKWLLILRAQVEAAREMSLRNMNKPTSFGQGAAGSAPRNMTPAALYEKLLQEYREAA